MTFATAPKEQRIWRDLVSRFGNSPGATKVKLAVSNGATTVTYTFPYTDVDTEYGVVATPTWSTTCYLSARTTSSCTLTFGTAAGASATVDIIIFRD